MNWSRVSVVFDECNTAWKKRSFEFSQRTGLSITCEHRSKGRYFVLFSETSGEYLLIKESIVDGNEKVFVDYFTSVEQWEIVIEIIKEFVGGIIVEGHVDYVPSIAKEDAVFDEDYYDKNCTFWNRLIVKAMCDSQLKVLARYMVGREKPLRVLQVGCEGGYLFDEMENRGITVVGYDVNIFATRRGKEKKNLIFIGDGRMLPFPDKSFDCVCSYDVLEHFVVKDIEKYLLEMLRVGETIIASVTLGTMHKFFESDDSHKTALTEAMWLELFEKILPPNYVVECYGRAKDGSWAEFFIKERE